MSNITHENSFLQCLEFIIRKFGFKHVRRHVRIMKDNKHPHDQNTSNHDIGTFHSEILAINKSGITSSKLLSEPYLG